MKVGDRVRLSRTIERMPFFTVDEGALGTVVVSDALSVEVKFDLPIPLARPLLDGVRFNNTVSWPGLSEVPDDLGAAIGIPYAFSDKATGKRICPVCGELIAEPRIKGKNYAKHYAAKHEAKVTPAQRRAALKFEALSKTGGSR